MTTYRIWPSTTPSEASLINQSFGGVIGTEFEGSEALTVVRIWTFSGSGLNELPVAVGIYQVSNTTLVLSDTSPSWSGAAGSGWISVNESVNLSASTRYKVVIQTSGSGTGLNYFEVYFESGNPGGSDIVNGPLTCFTETDSTNGQCSYSTSAFPAYPSTDAGSNNYWIDIEVEPTPVTHQGSGTWTQGSSLVVSGQASHFAAASWAQQSVATVQAFQNPPTAAQVLATLWAVYVTAATTYEELRRRWRLIAPVARTDGSAGYLYTQIYTAEQAKDNAYVAWAKKYAEINGARSYDPGYGPDQGSTG